MPCPKPQLSLNEQEEALSLQTIMAMAGQSQETARAKDTSGTHIYIMISGILHIWQQDNYPNGNRETSTPALKVSD